MKLIYLDISTAHLTPATREWLDENTPAQPKCSAITIAPYEYGCFTSVPSDQERIAELECPDDLKGVLAHARKEGCDVVRFDSDADVVDGLPVFED